MHQAKHLLRDTIIVIIGNLILAFGVAVFAVPSDLIVAGATGIALIVCEFISVNYATVVFVINMAMLLLGFIVLGKKFAAFRNWKKEKCINCNQQVLCQGGCKIRANIDLC